MDALESEELLLAAGPQPQPSPGRRSRTPEVLRIRAFRYYWLSQWPAQMGIWMQVVALGYVVYQLTHSSFDVGVVAAARGLPSLVLSLLGGVLADRLPRRRILLVTQTLLGLAGLALAALLAAGHATVWSIALVALVYGSTDAIDLPTRQALVADLVGRELVLSAVALTSAAMSATRIVGPSLAGLLIGWAGPSLCFLLLGLAYVFPLLVVLLVIPDIPPAARPGHSTALGDLREVAVLLRTDPLVRGILIGISALALFGVAYMPYLPVIASEHLHAGAGGLGFMYSVGGVGGLVGGLAIASVRRRGSSAGVLLVGGGVVYAFSLLVVSQVPSLTLAVPGLLGISLAFVALNTSMTALLQTETDPAVRGRLLGVYMTILSGFQPLGTLLYGLLSRAVPLYAAIAAGGFVVGVAAVWLGTRPRFRLLRA